MYDSAGRTVASRINSEPSEASEEKGERSTPAAAYDAALTEKVMHHVLDPEKHGFGDLIEESGSREGAMRRIVDSLDDKDDLPDAGQYEVGRVINGESVTIRGAVIDGVPRISTAFIPSKYLGGN
ncbi:hypothetical protein [Nocardia lasii]|uniref:Uncharacterized protein n=1 Tax=Nocardia lasii TaxID=1616107 RepID=A0ABW1JYT1_9NOCA